MRQTKPLPSPRFPRTMGLCRLSPVPAGSWPFPTLSPQSLYRCLDPYPVVLLWCSYPFLPKGLRPHRSSEQFGTPDYRRMATSTARIISGLQSFRYVQAPILALPSGCSHHWAKIYSGRPGILRHAELMRLPNMSCGIATCLNRVIGTTGLPPAGLRPCRLLPEPYHLGRQLQI
jgi:hypothetical protein